MIGWKTQLRQISLMRFWSLLKNCAMYLKVARIRAINKCQINNVPRGVDPAPERSPEMTCRQLKTHRIFQESHHTQGKSPQSPSDTQKSPCDTTKYRKTQKNGENPNKNGFYVNLSRLTLV